LQHVLPKGFRRVRDYGLLHANAKQRLSLLQRLVIALFVPAADRLTGAGFLWHFDRSHYFSRKNYVRCP